MLVSEIEKCENEKYKIINFQEDKEKYILPGQKYFSIPIIISTILKPELNKGNEIFFDKSLLEKPIEYININDFEIIKTDDIEQAKNKLLSKISNNFSYYLASISGINYFIFAIASFELANAGHFITSENREEKYVEIINSNDNTLIENLNNYLNALDEIQPVADLYNQFKNFKKRVIQSITFDDLEKAKDIFPNFIK